MKNTNPLFVRRNQCPVCSCHRLHSLYKLAYESQKMREYMDYAYRDRVEHEYLQGVDFEVAECENCGFLFQTNVLNDEGALRLYDVWIDPAYTEQRQRERDVNKALEYGILNFVERYLGCAEIKMLDYGAGFGRFCGLAKALGMNVSALEVSEERAASLNKMGVEAFGLDAERRKNYYHFINMAQVLEHLTDPAAALARIHEELRDDGLAAIAVPNCRGLKRALRSVDGLPIPEFQKALLDCAALQHVNSFTRETLREACERAGFSIVFRPLQFIGCCIVGTSPREFLKNVARPFYYRMGTNFFLRKK